jgi:imidazoleglycerol-phosphate dehydratase
MSSAQRRAHIDRQTRETAIRGDLLLEGSGLVSAATGIGFFDHMLLAFAFNACFDLDLTCEGDLHVDQHHTVEDVGIAIGEALASALGDRAGISRYGFALAPMDEALVRCAVDISGRPFAKVDLPWRADLAPTGFDYALVSEFHWGLCRAARVTVHLDGLSGDNNHHLCEASFKAFGLALRQAVALDPRRGGAVPSTKGSL